MAGNETKTLEARVMCGVYLSTGTSVALGWTFEARDQIQEGFYKQRAWMAQTALDLCAPATLHQKTRRPRSMVHGRMLRVRSANPGRPVAYFVPR